MSLNNASGIVYAPWPKELVDKLNAYQHNRNVHPYTCGYCRDTYGIWFVRRDDGNLIPEPPDYDRSGDGWKKIVCLDRELIATEKGWVCSTCDNIQDWCFGFSVNEEFLSPIPSFISPRE